MKIHLIAIGGAAMHNLALALHENGHQVTGSDDEIYNPARERLAEKGLLPTEMGWHESRITPDLEVIILGMHARKDNPELLKAQQLGLKIRSYPEFIYQHSKHKKRLVVAGSHGKTTTTSMIMHVLRETGRDFDYLVGALLEGFETMVRLSDAPIMVIEGDEYLSSPLDLVPKMHHYHPQIAIITGVAWDHINVFPTFENYVAQFHIFAQQIENEQLTEGCLIYDEQDNELKKIAETLFYCRKKPYRSFDSVVKDGKTTLIFEERKVPLKIFGAHNLANLRAAHLACRELGVTDEEFFDSIQSFAGAAKRLQTLAETPESVAFLDFAHAPSKLKATVAAVKAQFSARKLVACFELHTFSSLNKAFLQEYRHALAAADEAVVFFNEHTLKMKKMPPLSREEVAAAFAHPNLKIFTDNQDFIAFLAAQNFEQCNLLLMSSGTFNGLNLKALAQKMLLK